MRYNQYYFEIRGQDALKKILDETVGADQKALELAQSRYDTGIDDYISVVQARTMLQSAQAAAINVGVARAQYEHAIAVLLGKLAIDFSLPVKPLLTTPPPIPMGVPSQLLERRPDIASAERTLAKDNAIIGMGYGAFFPSIALNATGGFESSSFSNWFSWPSRFFSIGPSIAQTIFNGGLYRAELHQYTAVYNADLAAYRQTVLSSFQQEREQFAQKYEEMHRLVREPNGSTGLYVGAENWSFPIPLVATHGGWHFDADAGAEEIAARENRREREYGHRSVRCDE